MCVCINTQVCLVLLRTKTENCSGHKQKLCSTKQMFKEIPTFFPLNLLYTLKL